MKNCLPDYVLNLVINGIPSILYLAVKEDKAILVLNLVINGIPSILYLSLFISKSSPSFKPCYKWNTFNTLIPLEQKSVF